jgi:hypothetical protein
MRALSKIAGMALALGGGLLATSARPAAAAAAVGVDEASYVAFNDRANAAQVQADAASGRAAVLARQGGWAYKTGLVQGATRDAARWQAEADAYRAAASGPPVAAAPVSPALEDASARLAALRASGGWAYKCGAVARAEADVRALSGPQVVLMGVSEPLPPTAVKPVERTDYYPRAYR